MGITQKAWIFILIGLLVLIALYDIGFYPTGKDKYSVIKKTICDMDVNKVYEPWPCTANSDEIGSYTCITPERLKKWESYCG